MDKSLLFQGRGRMSCSAKYFPTFGWHMEMSSWLWPIRIPISLTKNTDGNYSLVRIKDPDFCWRLGEWWRWARKEMLGGELWWKIIWERECIYIICMTGSLCLIADIGVNLVNQIHFNLKRWGEKWRGKSIGYVRWLRVFGFTPFDSLRLSSEAYLEKYQGVERKLISWVEWLKPNAWR